MKTLSPSRTLLVIACFIVGALTVTADEQPTVKVANSDSVGPRTLEPQTRTAVVRDYLAAYVSSPHFRDLMTEMNNLKTSLSAIRYCLLLKSGSVTVRSMRAREEPRFCAASSTD